MFVQPVISNRLKQDYDYRVENSITFGSKNKVTNLFYNVKDFRIEGEKLLKMSSELVENSELSLLKDLRDKLKEIVIKAKKISEVEIKQEDKNLHEQLKSAFIQIEIWLSHIMTESGSHYLAEFTDIFRIKI